ncbi:MAG: c-type cytochrome [Vulcanimicrobiota bacterium]
MPNRIKSLLAFLALTTAGCVGGVQSTLDPLGPVAERQMSTFMVTLWVSLGMFAVVGSFLVYCIVKFRHVGEVTRGTALPDQGHGSAVTEIALILVSVGLVGVIALPTVTGIFWVGTEPENQDVMVIEVTGQQWWWKFDYPELGISTANEFAIPAGRPVRFNLNSADVQHSFWIPRLGGKMDLLPGQENWIWLEADPAMLAANDDELSTRDNKEGQRWEHLPDDYPFQGYILYGQCAEFCGDSHAFMKFRVLVLDDANFRKWVDWQKSDVRSTLDSEKEKEGFAVFRKNMCAQCHTVRGTIAGGIVGPDLTHFGSRTSVAAGWLENTPDNLGHWLMHPDDVKPGNIMYKTGYYQEDENGEPINNYKIQLDEAAKDILVEYLMSLE